MSTPPVTSTDGAASSDAVGASRLLTQGITATWWYTFSGVLFIEVMMVFVWLGVLPDAGVDPLGIAVFLTAGAVWAAATVPLLLQYRHRDPTTTPAARWRGVLLPLAVAIACGALAGVTSGFWVVGVTPVAQAVTLLGWPRGVRLRLVLAVTVVLGALWFIDLRTTVAQAEHVVEEPSWWLLGFYSTILPAMTVLSLWFWDVIIALDRARAAEARLGATQERLRVATDVHDLQGHHLQVIALQLELAEKLMAKDPDAALAQLRAARESVDEARQGTRDLATHFRSVPLRDEIANAIDLLRAAGATAEATVDAEADRAPASVLGPVIRETTTNALRHGGGGWARLSLTRVGESWRYGIANDATSDAAVSADGSGLDGIVHRVTEAGGTVEIDRDGQQFTVVVTVPGERR